MNIFYLSHNITECAKLHLSKHSVKMIVEHQQLLCTAHRILDGTPRQALSKSGRKATRWILSDERESILYGATHPNHPSAIWARKSIHNYNWLAQMTLQLCREYTYRYGKIHKSEREGLVQYLIDHAPQNISMTEPFTQPTPAMPDECIVPGDSIASYRKYYVEKKQHIASWQGRVNSRPVPDWYVTQ